MRIQTAMYSLFYNVISLPLSLYLLILVVVEVCPFTFFKSAAFRQILRKHKINIFLLKIKYELLQ